MVWMGQHCYGERGVGDQELTFPLFHGLEEDLAEDTAEAGVSLLKRELIASEACRNKCEPNSLPRKNHRWTCCSC